MLVDEARLKELLASVEAGALSRDEALARLRDLPCEDLGYAALDHHHTLRTGYGHPPNRSPKTPTPRRGRLGLESTCASESLDAASLWEWESERTAKL